MNRVLLLLGLFVAISAHADTNTNVYINGGNAGCTPGETRCGSDGWGQQCRRRSDNSLTEWTPTFRSCGSAMQCAAGDKKCGPDGAIMECRVNPIGGATTWWSTDKSCK